VTFEPNEIMARSSGISSSVKRKSPINQSFNGIDFSKDDIMAQLNNEMMAEINNEEFLSSSKWAEQLSIDQACWQQNHTYCMPVTSTEKQKINLSSLSGIIGEVDLSIEYVYFCMYVGILCKIHVSIISVQIIDLVLDGKYLLANTLNVNLII